MREAGAPKRRAEAYRVFRERGLPNRRVESWHYTDLKSVLAKPAPLAGSVEFDHDLLRTHESIRFVTLDGKFRPELSDLSGLPLGLRVQSLHEALASDDPAISAVLWPDDAAFSTAIALNGALMQDGVVISVAPGVSLDRAIEFVTLVSAPEPQSVFTRSALIVGAGAKVRAIETNFAQRKIALSPAQQNHLLALCLEVDSTLDLFTHIAGSCAGSVDVFSLIANLGSRAQLNANLLSEGGGLSRRQIFASLDGADARAAFNGVTLARARQHADTTLVIDHRQPHGASHERFRTILDEQAVGVFQGKIIVRPGAQKTDGVMQSKAILLSDGATMNNKPELEIFADDVKCGHGATCGRLDREQLFYLMARGLPRREAESLLLEGFANEAFVGVDDEALREFIAGRIVAWLAERSPA
jgi:Fe-S cluster assembly protein SufD